MKCEKSVKRHFGGTSGRVVWPTHLSTPSLLKDAHEILNSNLDLALNSVLTGSLECSVSTIWHCFSVYSILSVGLCTWLLVEHLWVLASVCDCIFICSVACEGTHGVAQAALRLLQSSCFSCLAPGWQADIITPKWHHFEINYILIFYIYRNR